MVDFDSEPERNSEDDVHLPPREVQPIRIRVAYNNAWKNADGILPHRGSSRLQQRMQACQRERSGDVTQVRSRLELKRQSVNVSASDSNSIDATSVRKPASKRTPAKKNPKANVPEGTEEKDMEKRHMDKMASMLQAQMSQMLTALNPGPPSRPSIAQLNIQEEIAAGLNVAVEDVLAKQPDQAHRREEKAPTKGGSQPNLEDEVSGENAGGDEPSLSQRTMKDAKKKHTSDFTEDA